MKRRWTNDYLHHDQFGFPQDPFTYRELIRSVVKLPYLSLSCDVCYQQPACPFELSKHCYLLCHRHETELYRIRRFTKTKLAEAHSGLYTALCFLRRKLGKDVVSVIFSHLTPDVCYEAVFAKIDPVVQQKRKLRRVSFDGN